MSVSFGVTQFKPVQESFVVFGFVPNADNLDVEVKMGKPTLSNGKFRRTTYFFHGESGSQPGSR